MRSRRGATPGCTSRAARSRSTASSSRPATRSRSARTAAWRSRRRDLRSPALRPGVTARVTRLHLVDGTYELFRAHYAPRPDHRAPAGWDAKATVGVVASLLALLNDPAEAVTHIAVAFDNPIRSFRNDLFPAYKSDEGVPPELRAQFDSVEDAVRALGVVVWSMGDGRPTTRWPPARACSPDQVEQVRIMTPDKDLGQCLRGERVVQIDRRQRKLTDEALPRDARLRPGQHARLPGPDRRHRRRHPRSRRLRRKVRVGADRRLRAHRDDSGPPAPVDGQTARRPRTWRRRWPSTARRRCSTASWRRWSTRCRSPKRWTICASGARRAPASRRGATSSARRRSAPRPASGPRTEPPSDYARRSAPTTHSRSRWPVQVAAVAAR